MASYRTALEKFRKQNSQFKEPTIEPVRPTGMMANRKPVGAKINGTAQYDPSDYAQRAMRGISTRRADFQSIIDQEVQKAQAMANDGVAKAVDSVASGLMAKPVPVEAEPMAETPKAPVSDKAMSVNDPSSLKGPVKSSVIEDAAFIQKVKGLAAKYKTSPENLMAVMHFETGGSFSPSQKNAAGSSATGLIQFMRSTAEGLGTSTEELAKMSRLDQLDYVDKYFAGTGLAKKDNNSLSDVYMSVLYPVAAGKDDEYVLFKAGTKAYEQNKGLDKGGKGYVTKADATSKVARFVDIYKGV